MRMLCIARGCKAWDSGVPERLIMRGWWWKTGEQGLCPVHSKEEYPVFETAAALKKKRFPKPHPAAKWKRDVRKADPEPRGKG
jgi:hypothetical protein